ncbi:Growth arrest and DNA damage-inducible proteins-interacting protein 1 [Fasciolopsis buskii]|uniref:Large ribosomal subunit protein mL64 n=1 Tax=Fasciolopsis buskii TaxID=27845 RepID=A0A8E0RKF9_9TREM|nr:Growth arrest and DNA damage-inducible proteins-interacting protein 1 [Fasciolopsis buski]
MLPHLPGCEGLLELLKPMEWTPHVYPRVAKVFASKGHEPALHFYGMYLLPKVKQDIEENRRLCVQLFEALIASMFRPEEFVSGIFLPWIQTTSFIPPFHQFNLELAQFIQSEMSKTEGVILAHLIRKATLKARFASVALALIMEEEFSIPRSMVIESLLAKRYHMPEAALKRVTQYFLRGAAHALCSYRCAKMLRSIKIGPISAQSSPYICPTRAKKYYPGWRVPYSLDDFQNVTRSKPNPYEAWDNEWKAAGLRSRELQPFDISLLPQNLKWRLKPTKEFFQPKFRSELTLDYRRRLFGVYGLASGVDPATLFLEPRTDKFDQAVEEATTRPISEVLEERQRREKEAAEAEEKLMKNIKASLAKMPELLTKFEAQKQKQAELAEAKELKKKEILEEARDRFGYYVSPQDPKFKKLREEIEARQKQMRKEKRKKNQSES